MTSVFSKKKKKKEERVRRKNEVKSEKNSKRKSPCGICPRTRVHSCGGEGPGIPVGWNPVGCMDT